MSHCKKSLGRSVPAFGLAALLASTLMQAQAQNPPCQGVAFSTEEDFISQAPPPADGNPIISDGDLLAFDPSGGTRVCARNRELLRAFQLESDLGLDAVDVIDVRERLIAFSTELDDPNGRFTSGDLILTSGGVLPNAALLSRFGLEAPADFGLDALHLVGDDSGIRRLVDLISSRGREEWLEDPASLAKILRDFEIDIWFSVEGTALPLKKPTFLDGDLLSARDGSIVAPNELLLSPPVPAGIPKRGVDFGLDAVTAERKANKESLHFSTEILFEQQVSFTDGDVLRLGGGVAIKNYQLIRALEPVAEFVGLDALHFEVSSPPRDPNIQSLCGVSHPVGRFDGGRVPIGAPGTGLYLDPDHLDPSGNPLPRPCGHYVPIDGFLPASGVSRFRVAYRPVGTPAPTPGTAAGIGTEWLLNQWSGFFGCLPIMPFNSMPGGWFDADAYLAAKSGALTGCVNSGLRLAVWETASLPAKDGHYIVWLEWEDVGGNMHREPLEHHLQLDNTLPTIAPFPQGLQVRQPGANGNSTLVQACGEAPDGTSLFEVWGQFDDAYYWNYRLRLRGGLPPDSQPYGPHNYYHPHDGTAGVKNTDDTGTAPDSTTKHLRNIDMHDLRDSFQDCCYVLDLWVRDRAIRHRFNRILASDISGSSQFQANAFVTFAAAP